MAGELSPKKMSTYTDADSIADAGEKAYYKANAKFTTFGKMSAGDAGFSNYNLTLGNIAEGVADGTTITESNGKLSASIPVTNVTVGNNTVVENGVAIIPKYYGQNPIMNNGYNFSLSYNNDQFELAGTNNTELTLTNPVPAPGTNAHRGEFLTVNNSDEIVWGAAPAPSIKGSATINYDTGNSGALSVKYNSDSLDSDETNGLKVKRPVPPTTSANDGDVLTVDANGDYDWAPVSGGGGGGGNPYTKVSVTAGARYANGKESYYGGNLFDQDVVIANNTYSIVSNNDIGYGPTSEYSDSNRLDNIVIKLPANTEFPMAVVEFNVVYNENDSYNGCVNDVKVKVGDNELTRMFAAPYQPNGLMLDGDNNDEFTYWSTETHPNQGNPYYTIHGVMTENRGADHTAFVGGTKVQVQIFGSCFSVSASRAGGEPSAS